MRERRGKKLNKNIVTLMSSVQTLFGMPECMYSELNREIYDEIIYSLLAIIDLIRR